jgi:endoglucanase
VDQYAFQNEPMFVLYMPTESGKTMDYDLHVPAGNTVFVYAPVAGQERMSEQQLPVKNGVARINVTETPVFVTLSPATAK